MFELFEDLLREVIKWFRNKNGSRKPISAEGLLDKMQNATKITFTEFDASGKIVPIDLTKKQITFASDNPAAATIDSAQQTGNPDGSVSCPVVSLTSGAGGIANITGVDLTTNGPDGKPLAAGDVDTVVPVAAVPVSATAVLS